MKTVLDLNSIDAKAFFLKEESYCSFELPEYFSFQTLITSLSKEIKGKTLRDCTTAIKPKDVEGVNYTLLTMTSILIGNWAAVMGVTQQIQFVLSLR